MTEFTFTTTDKIKSLRRELGMRQRVYPKLIHRGKMSELSAAREIAIIEHMLSDYRERAMTEQLSFTKIEEVKGEAGDERE